METENFNWLDPFAQIDLGLAEKAGVIKEWAINNRHIIQPIKDFLAFLITGIENALQSAPPLVMLVLLSLLAWQLAGRRVGAVVLTCLIVLGLLGPDVWPMAMTTLSIVISAVSLCFIIGLPLGIVAAKSDLTQACLRPVLDTMQTIPAFVYLVPVVMLFGIGNVSGVLVTVIFGLPPLIRLTALGIRGVNPHVVEAARAFGGSPWQILAKVELPLAAPSIMAGINQTIMLALSMVVIASMIAVKGLGNEVLRAMGRLDAGKALVGGLGIVILAIVLDRVTQGMGRADRDRARRVWWRTGPVGAVTSVAERVKFKGPDLQTTPFQKAQQERA